MASCCCETDPGVLKLNRSDGGHAPIVRQTQAGEGRVEEGRMHCLFVRNLDVCMLTLSASK